MNGKCPTSPTRKLYASALSVALGLAVLAWSATARAADDDVSFDTKIFRGILESLGLRKDGEGIHYQERAPLVIPSGRALPPPEKSDAALANNPAWPIDPDVQRRKEEAALERNRPNADEALLNDQRALRPNELTPGRKPRTARRTNPDTYQAPDNGSSGPLMPSELGNRGSIFSRMFDKVETETAKFTGEPARSALTEPPPGYQTPSPDQPYGFGKEKLVAPKAGDNFLKQPVGSQ